MTAEGSGKPPPLGHAADDRLRETVVGSRTVHRGHYLDVRVDDIVTADGRRSTRDIVGHPGAVAIVALDGEDRVLMVRQFRLAAGRTLLEIPAGTLNRVEDGSLEDPDAAARRELEEETGVRAGSWQHLGAFWTAPGFATELMHLYLARDLTPADPDGRIGPDEDERLELERVPWRDAVALAERGEIADAKSLVGLLRLARILEPAGVPTAAGAAEPEPGAGAVATARWQMSMRRLITTTIAIMHASRGMMAVGLFALAAGVWTLAIGAPIDVWGWPLLFGALIVTGLWCVPFVWWQARRRPEVIAAENRLTADASGLSIEASYGGGRWKWSLFKRVREHRGLFLLDTQVGQAFAVPFDAFDPENLAAFRRLLLEAGFSPDGKVIERA